MVGNTNLVQTAQDAVLDAVAIRRVAEIVEEKAQKLKLGGVGFDLDEYIIRLKNVLKSTSENYEWSEISDNVNKANLLCPTADFMLGPIDLEIKEKAARRAGVRLVKDKLLTQRPMTVQDFNSR